MRPAWPCFIYRLIQETLDRVELRETVLPLPPAQSLTGHKASSFWPGSEATLLGMELERVIHSVHKCYCELDAVPAFM